MLHSLQLHKTKQPAIYSHYLLPIITSLLTQHKSDRTHLYLFDKISLSVDEV